MTEPTAVKVGKTYLTKKMIARLGWGKALLLLGLATLILKAFEGEDEDVTIAVEEVDSDEEPSEEGDSGEETEEAAAEETGDEEATEEEPAEE